MKSNISTDTPVSVIGLGSMGTELAKAFLKNGNKTTVWNRSAEKAAPLASAGAVQAETVTEALTASPLVIICLLDYDVIFKLLENTGKNSLQVSTIINLTNGTPRESRRMASFLENKGVKAYLDGGIMAVPSLISTEHAFILYSGPKAIFERYEPVLSILGGANYVGSDPGLASLNDLALLSGMYGMFGGFIHAAALTKSENINAVEFSSALLIPWLQAMISVLPEMAKQIDTKNYSAGESNISMQAVGYENIIQASLDQGVNADLLIPFQTLLNRRVADGFGKDDVTGLFELIKAQT